uniref:Serine/threonine-protein kinase haspin n=1 Tax=Electrophorus electricus TaxID=8005 RepID=A0A4W4HMU7_ELEEL
MDISSHLSKHTSSRLQVAQDTDWPHLCPKPLTLETRHGKGDRDVSSDCTSLKPLCLISSSSTSSSPSSPPGLELCVSEPELIDRLKVECLSSCLTVSLRPLERSVLRQAQKGPGEARVASPQPPETEGDGRAQDGDFPAGKLPDLNSYAIELPYGTEGQVGGLRRRLSNSFLRSKASPQPGEAPGKAPAPAVLKERNGGGTGRKACVSGLSAVRWSKRGMAEQNRKHRTKETAAWSKPGDCSLNYLLPARTEKHTRVIFNARVAGTTLHFFFFFFPFAHYDEDISDADKVYQECMQDGPLSFEDCIPPERMKRCSKIGEGTFGEVFSTINDSNQTVALKIIPVEGCQKVNSEPQKTFGEILHEIIISKELSSLNSKEKTKTNGFIRLNNLHCVRGCYPSALLKAWDKFDQEKGSENDRPDFFSEEQLFLILEFEFGGSDLENMNGKLSSMTQAKSILHQVTAALAVAEHALCFEHRDLHWGNILVKTTKQKNNEFILNGSVHSIETRGVHVNIIDYSLSRLEIDGLTVSCDIANDEELFMGQGDYQFEIYRLMRKENNNCWSEYNPRSNVLWLHYLADKLLAMRYKTKPQSSQQKAVKSSLQTFCSEILNYSSATHALLHCRLFN